MLAKIWKKVLLIILIVACLFNIILKLVNVISFDKIIDDVKTFFEIKDEEKEN